MKKGDKLVCLETINNGLGNPLFIMGKTYTILSVDDNEVFLDHILYANEYNSFPIEWVNKKFKKAETII
jgi:hypothetical protein